MMEMGVLFGPGYVYFLEAEFLLFNFYDRVV
jgi:hypothetical protein